MIRKGLIPFHSWYPALFSGASLATALVVTMPQVATYTAARLLVGHADGVPHELVVLANAALLTAAYGAALAVVQPRRPQPCRHARDEPVGDGFCRALRDGAHGVVRGAGCLGVERPGPDGNRACRLVA